MIIPYKYRGFIIEGFYDPINQETMGYSIYAGHPDLQAVPGLGGFASWEEAKDAMETSIDELLASWN